MLSNISYLINFINYSNCYNAGISNELNALVYCMYFHTMEIKPLISRTTMLFCRYSSNYTDSVLKRSLKAIPHTVLGQITSEKSWCYTISDVILIFVLIQHHNNQTKYFLMSIIYCFIRIIIVVILSTDEIQ